MIEEFLRRFAAGSLPCKVLTIKSEAESTVLKTPSEEVDPTSDRALTTMKRLAATAINDPENMWGLAAPQIGINERIFLYTELDDTKNPPEYYFLLNPTYEGQGEEKIDSYESCFSVPEKVGLVSRYKSIRLKGTRYDGTSFTKVDRVVDTENARMFQHEIDHLEGTLYIDSLKLPEALWTFDEFETLQNAS